MSTTDSIAENLSACTTHERFSIMLQERFDQELSQLHAVVSSLAAEVASMRASMQDAAVHQKQVVLWMVLQHYRVNYSNTLGSPSHYLRSFATDLDVFVRRRFPEAADSGACDDYSVAATAICAPFMRARIDANLGAPIDHHHHLQEEQTKRLLQDIGTTFARYSHDALLQFVCDVMDPPDLLDDVE